MVGTVTDPPLIEEDHRAGCTWLSRGHLCGYPACAWRPHGRLRVPRARCDDGSARTRLGSLGTEFGVCRGAAQSCTLIPPNRLRKIQPLPQAALEVAVSSRASRGYARRVRPSEPPQPARPSSFTRRDSRRSPRDRREAPSPQPREMLPMADLASLEPGTIALLQRMSAPVAGPEQPILIPSLFRYFAHDRTTDSR